MRLRSPAARFGSPKVFLPCSAAERRSNVWPLFSRKSGTDYTSRNCCRYVLDVGPWQAKPVLCRELSSC